MSVKVPVIQPKDSSISLNRLGQRRGLSPYDIMHVNIEYCPEYVVRLRGGSNKREGRVEVKVRGNWGTVYDDSFDINDANVIRKFLGFPRGKIAFLGGHFGQGSGPILIDEIGCNGQESSPFHCSHRGLVVSNCFHQHDAGVRCIDPPVRLVGGSGSHEGHVEILLHGEWGTVCDDEWTINDARVVCRQLGWSDQWPLALTNAQFGQGTGTIWLDAVQCTGSEAHLYDCPNLGVGIHDCEHAEDAGVRCDCGNECVYGPGHI